MVAEHLQHGYDPLYRDEPSHLRTVDRSVARGRETMRHTVFLIAVLGVCGCDGSGGDERDAVEDRADLADSEVVGDVADGDDGDRAEDVADAAEVLDTDMGSDPGETSDDAADVPDMGPETDPGETYDDAADVPDTGPETDPSDARDDAETPDACAATTCPAEGAECGTIGDGCGGTLDCGPCVFPAVCGGGGTPNVCGAPAPCGTAPAGSSPEQAEAFDVVQAIRARVGVPCLSMIPAINTSAQNHAVYMRLNAGTSCTASAHDEVAGCAGFTGEWFTDRMWAAGYRGTGMTEIMHFTGDATAAIDGWLVTLWHRIPLVHPNMLDFGAGIEPGGAEVMDFGDFQAVDRNGVWVYPPDGMAGVPPYGGTEYPVPPDPPASCGGAYGTFVSILFDSSATVSFDTHELRGPAGPVEHGWMVPSGYEFWLAWGSYAMIPCPLAPATTYTVHVAGTVNGVRFDRTTTFTTE